MAEERAKGNICRRDLRRDGESPEENGRKGMRTSLGWEAADAGLWPWSERERREKYERGV